MRHSFDQPCAACGCAALYHWNEQCLDCRNHHVFRALDKPLSHMPQSRQSSGGTTPMAHMPNTRLPALTASPDGKWLHCPQCSRGYWGAFRPTDFIVEKFTAHVSRKHADQAPKADVEAGADAPVAPKVIPAKAQRKPAKAKVAKIAAKAKAKGDGEVKIVREAGPSTADLLGDAVADLLADVKLELDPRLQLAQGPRQFSDEGNNRFEGPRRAKDANKGQDVVARVQAGLSPIKGW